MVATGSFSQIVASASNSYVIRSDGSLWAWGDNTFGQVPSVSLNRSSPVQVGTGSVNSVLLNTSTYLTVPANSVFAFGTGDFTVECWVYLLANTASAAIFGPWTGGATTSCWVFTQGTSAVNLRFGVSNGSAITFYESTSSGGFQFQSWTHIAACRSSGTLRLYANGVLLFTTADSTNMTPTQTLQINGITGFGSMSNMYISNVRVIKGQALYTAQFVPSTTSLTTSTVGATGSGAAGSISGTISLLTCQSPNLVDNSSNNFAITQIGSPFVDRLNTPSMTQTNTFDSWSQVTASKFSNFAFGIRNNGKLYAWGDNSLYQLGDGTSLMRFSPTQITASSWSVVSTGQSHAVAVTNDNKLYVWGSSNSADYGQFASVASFSWAKISASGSHTLAIRSDNMLFAWGANASGQLGDGTVTQRNSPIQVGISSWSQVSASWSSSYAIRSDGGLFTWGANNNGQLGDPYSSTNGRSSPVQIGTGSANSVSFNGTSNYLSIPDSVAFAFGSGDFTVEAWVYQLASKAVTIVSQWPVGSTSFIFRIDVTGKLSFAYNTGVETNSTASTGTISYNTWAHVAWTKIGTTVRYYINGVLDATTNTVSGTFVDSTGPVLIGLYNT
jgi:hypothetical protein